MLFRGALGDSLLGEMTIDRLRPQSLLGQPISMPPTGRNRQRPQVDRYQQMAFDLLRLRRRSPSITARTDETPQLWAVLFVFGGGAIRKRRARGFGVLGRVRRGWLRLGHAQQHYPRMKNGCTGLTTRYGLLTDLDRRGLLDDTLVVSPANMPHAALNKPTAERDHWAGLYVAVAGGGAPQAIVGASVKRLDVARLKPQGSPTMYHPRASTRTRWSTTGSPLPSKQVMSELLA